MNSNNKLIIKNTLFLYLRLMVIMIVGLYTSRVVLSILGFSDYGIYNVVGGIVAMFAFINNAMVASSQRFISYEIGLGEKGSLTNVFATTKCVHITLALIIFLLSEVVSVLVLNNSLNIPNDRIIAANWVLQGTIISFVINVLSVPYRASVVAHEKMSFFAYQSIIDVLMKLFIVYVLYIAYWDKLIVYSLLTVFVNFISFSILSIYAKRKFYECKSRLSLNKEKFKEMFSFASWSLIGNIGYSSKDQISNMIINVFCGTIVNAARGIALQLSGVIASFSNGFITALNPQITQSYASNSIDRSVQLVYVGSRLSFYLMSIIALPVIINVDYILYFWLGDVPKYTNIFICLTLISSLICSMSDTVTYAIQATGDIKSFQIVICIVLLLELPIVYILLYNEISPAYVMIPTIIVNFAALVARIIILRNKVHKYSISYYLVHIVLKNFILFTIALIIMCYVKCYFDNSLLGFIIISIISELIYLPILYFLGLNKQEKNILVNTIKNKINT